MSRLNRRLWRLGPEPDPIDRIRRAIITIDGQRRAATSGAGTALVNQAQVTQECHRQIEDLRHARAEISGSLALALAATQRIAARPPAEGDEDPTAYVATAAGLRLALDALEAASSELEAVVERSRDDLDSARRTLHRVRHNLDSALEEQIRQLGEVERRHRRQTAEALRREMPS